MREILEKLNAKQLSEIAFHKRQAYIGATTGDSDVQEYHEEWLCIYINCLEDSKILDAEEARKFIPWVTNGGVERSERAKETAEFLELFAEKEKANEHN